MSRHNIIETKIWEDPDFIRMESNNKLIALFVMNNRAMTKSGIYSLTCEEIAHKCGLSPDDARDRLIIHKIKNIEYDKTASVVFVVNHLAYNPGGDPKLVIRSISRDYLTTKTYLWESFKKRYPAVWERVQEDIQKIAPGTTYQKPDSHERTGAQIEREIQIAAEKITNNDAQSILRVLKFLPINYHDAIKENLDRIFPDGHEYDLAKKLYNAACR